MRKLYKLIFSNLSSNTIFLNCINPVRNSEEEVHFHSIHVNKQIQAINLVELLKIKKQSFAFKLSKESFVKKYLHLMNNPQLTASKNTEQVFKDVILFLIT
jgi:myosin heavy subunit